jgi:hypothetical protein
MTRVPRDPETGKPLPTPPRDEEWLDEPTVKTKLRTPEDIDAHLKQRAESGQGDDMGWTFFGRRPL